MAKALVNWEDAVKRAAMQFNRTSSVDTLKWASEREHVRSIIAKNKDLKNAIPETILQSILQTASMGLSLNPALQHCYLIPRRTKRGDPNAPVICYPSPSYRGLSKIAMDSGNIIQIRAEVVYQADKFKYKGPVEKPIHEPVLTQTHREQRYCIGAYAVAEYVNGSFSCEYVDIHTILQIREMSEFKNSVMYTKLWTEGYKKIAIRRLCKTLGISSPRLNVATDVLNQNEGADFKRDPHEGEVIEGESTVIDETPDSITPEQEVSINEWCESTGLAKTKICEAYGVNQIDEIPAHLYDAVIARIQAYGEKAKHG